MLTSPRVVTMSLPAAARIVVDGDGDRQHVAGQDRPVVDEALLAVHDPRVVDAELGVADDLPARLEGQDDRERRRRDDVGMAERLRGGAGRGRAGFGSLIASANSAIFSRPTPYGGVGG